MAPMATSPPQLDRYFFPYQEVRANPEHDANENWSGTKVKANVNCFPVDEGVNTFAVELVVSSDDESSENPPYFFNIQVFGYLVVESEIELATAQRIAEATGTTVLVGAIREHLASLTARGPWGTFLLPVLSLNTGADKPTETGILDT
jgi:preprotein translocase subunit SecB